MASCHGNPSPSHLMESVCRHFSPPPLLYLAVYFLRLSWANTRRVRWSLAMVTRLHRIQWSPFAEISPLSPFYFAVYFLSLSGTNTRRVQYTLAMATRLHRIRLSPAVCRHVFQPGPQLYTLLYIHCLSRTDFRWVWLFMAFFRRTQFGCIGLPSLQELVSSNNRFYSGARRA